MIRECVINMDKADPWMFIKFVFLQFANINKLYGLRH